MRQQQRSIASLVILLVLIVAAMAQMACAAASIKGIQVSVVGRDGVKKGHAAEAFPNKIAKKLSISGSDVLQFGVEIKDISSDGEEDNLAQQVMLSLSSESHKDLAVVVESKKQGIYETIVDFSKVDTFKGYTGSLKAVLFVSGGSFAEPVAYSIGTFYADFPLKDTEENNFALKKEIHHKFRPEEKMPNIVISQSFSLLVLAPWALLLISWIGLGANVKNLFANASNFFWGSAYLGSLAVSLTLFYVYWLQLNLFQLLGYGAILWFISAAIGWRALVSRAALRLSGK